MRVHTVNKARKDQGHCEKCGKDITAGMGYRYISPRYGGKRKRHLDCPSWRPSEMTSGKIATAYAAQEGGHDDLDAIATDVTDTASAEEFVANIKAALEAVAAGANDCAADYQDGYDNMPENFQVGPTGEEIQEKIDILESWASDLESWEPDTNPDDVTDPGDTDVDELYETWMSDTMDSAREVIDSLEL